MEISHEAVARRLRDAYSTGTIPPLRDALAATDAAGAYAVQAINTRHWLDAGRRMVGRKIGLTAEAVQKQLGVDRPDYGVLFEDMQIPNGGVLRPSRAIQPKAEAEIAIVMASDLDDPQAAPDDVLAATAHVCAALEIVDSRISDWRITFADTVADNGSSAFFVLGAPRAVGGFDWLDCHMTLRAGGTVASTGRGRACLGHPLAAAAWLARTLAACGEPLRRGDVVLTGALGPMVTLVAGTEIEADIEGLGAVSFTFAEARP